MKEKKVMKLASRGKRLGAYCIDAVVPVIATIMYLAASVAMLVKQAMNFGDFGFGYGYGYPGYDFGYGHNSGASATMTIAGLLWIAYLIAQMVFYRQSKTIGKAALGLQVVSSTDGEPVDFWKMLFREWFVKRASSSIFFLGYIWVAIDEKNRGWHDKILDTYVVDLKETEIMNRKQTAYRQERPAPKSAPVYDPPVSEAAGTSAAALADKEPVSTVIEPAEPAAEFAAPGTAAEIKDSVVEVAEIVTVTAQDTVSKLNDHDLISAETAEEVMAETPEEVKPDAAGTLSAAPEEVKPEILKEEEPSGNTAQEAFKGVDEQE